MPIAITLGELLIDFVSTQENVPLTQLPAFAGAAGGAPANVAVGLARLGLSVGFIGKVGDDPFGRFLRHTLDAEGVETAGLRTAQGARTTLAFVASRTDGAKEISFHRHPGADMLLTADEVKLDYLRSARLFHFGSVSLSRPPAREATLFAAHAAKRAGLLVSYDPNWRPTLWDDPVEARGQLWHPMPLAHVVHCAEEEWEFITGSDDLPTGAAKILQTGPGLVVVTQGAGGCYYDTGDFRGQVPGFPVQVVDPLGAGDAFVATMLAELVGGVGEDSRLKLEESDLRRLLQRANAAGAIACTGRGVIPSLPTPQQIEELLQNGPRTG